MARIPRRFRDAVAVLGIALVASALILAPPLDRFRGLSIDVLTMLRWRVFGGMHKPEQSPTVVVALDEETYRTPPFAGTSAITWSTEIGQVLTAILGGDAKVVGFDIVFPTSIEQSEIPFGDGTLGGRLRGFDREFLRALALGARDGKVVLGRRRIAIFQFCRRRPSASPLAKPRIFARSTSTTIRMTWCAVSRSA